MSALMSMYEEKVLQRRSFRYLGLYCLYAFVNLGILGSVEDDRGRRGIHSKLKISFESECGWTTMKMLRSEGSERPVASYLANASGSEHCTNI